MQTSRSYISSLDIKLPSSTIRDNRTMRRKNRTEHAVAIEP